MVNDVEDIGSAVVMAAEDCVTAKASGSIMVIVVEDGSAVVMAVENCSCVAVITEDGSIGCNEQEITNLQQNHSDKRNAFNVALMVAVAYGVVGFEVPLDTL